MDRPRLFIAAVLPTVVRDTVAGVADAARKRFPAGAVRWSPPENLHLTLRFLGETATKNIAPLGLGLDALAGSGHVALCLAGVGCFPSGGQPQILWIGVGAADGAGDGVSKGLYRLQERVEFMVRDLGFAAEQRPYRPHLTVGRVKRQNRGRRGKENSADIRVAARADWAVVPLVPFKLDCVVLFQSRLGPGGADYTLLHQVRL
jgi:RNA 2',3'-cyclic 3'-phosphodiesterase